MTLMRPGARHQRDGSHVPFLVNLRPDPIPGRTAPMPDLRPAVLLDVDGTLR
jgi:hypothetical protein